MRTEAFFAFMREREQVRLNRLMGRPYPWTDDPILRAYKFTNVKRAHDRTTQVLVKEFYKPHAGAYEEVLLLNAALFRYFGTWEFAQAIGWHTTWDEFTAERVRQKAAQRLKDKETVFTGAYVITNQGISAPKQDVVCSFITALWTVRAALLRATLNDSWKELVTAMRQVSGFGGSGFMAKEICLDLCFTDFWGTPDGRPTDADVWTPVGPGARRGAARVWDGGTGSADDALSEKDTLAITHKLFAVHQEHWPERWVKLELHDIQFQLCEFDKYERVRLGQGRPRSRYRPPT